MVPAEWVDPSGATIAPSIALATSPVEGEEQAFGEGGWQLGRYSVVISWFHVRWMFLDEDPKLADGLIIAEQFESMDPGMSW